MKIDSPTVNAFVEAMNAQDAKRFSALFATEAEVRDEGHTYRGPAEIEAWIVEAWRKYQPQTAPQGVTGTAAHLVLTAEVSGSFDGSPVVLQYHFELAGEKIAKLRITA